MARFYREAVARAYTVCMTRTAVTRTAVTRTAVTRTADLWWLWAEEDDAHVHARPAAASARCDRWVAGHTDDGPDIDWLADWAAGVDEKCDW